MSSEKSDFLYGYAAAAVDRELARFESIEAKAGRLGTLLTVVIVAFSTLLGATAALFIPPKQAIDWMVCLLAGASFCVLFAAWLKVLTALKVVIVPRMPLTQEVIDLIEKEPLSTSKRALATTGQQVISEMREVLLLKSRALQGAYENTIGAGWLLTMTLATIIARVTFFSMGD